MNIEKTAFEGLIILKPRVFTDERGYFTETYNRKMIEAHTKTHFVQDNESQSRLHVLRGLHFQKPPFAQAKLIRVVKGKILDVVVDLRKESATFGKSFSYILDSQKKEQLFIPEGFAHGFLSLEDQTIINYKCSAYYHKASEDALLWNDPDFGIDWGIEHPVLSDKDRNAKKFSTFESPF